MKINKAKYESDLASLAQIYRIKVSNISNNRIYYVGKIHKSKKLALLIKKLS